MRERKDHEQFEFSALIVFGCIIGAGLVFVVKAIARVFA